MGTLLYGLERKDATRMPRRRVTSENGPLNDLVVRLDELHLQAGRPSTREIARSITGRSGISHTTVHKVLGGDHVPKQPTLLLIVDALGGDVGEFRQLWLKARREYEAALTKKFEAAEQEAADRAAAERAAREAAERAEQQPRSISTTPGVAERPKRTSGTSPKKGSVYQKLPPSDATEVQTRKSDAAAGSSSAPMAMRGVRRDVFASAEEPFEYDGGYQDYRSRWDGDPAVERPPIMTKEQWKNLTEL